MGLTDRQTNRFFSINIDLDFRLLGCQTEKDIFTIILNSEYLSKVIIPQIRSKDLQ